MANESAADDEPFPSEADVDAVIVEFGGDHRAAIRALLHDVAALSADYDLSVSRAYVRGNTMRVVNGSRRGLGGGSS